MNPNRRILIVDDNQAIHDDYRKILGAPDALDPAEAAEAALAAAEARLLGIPQIKADPAKPFEVDTATQGAEALLMAERALAEGRPYTMAFVDFRMPPGWNGVETAKRIWQVCPDLQIVICTAFADCSWDEVLASLKPQDRLIILKKPFDSIEVRQLASALTEKWALRQEAKTILGNMEQAVQRRTQELEESQLATLNMMQDAVHHRAKAERALEDLKREVAERKQLEAQLLQSQKMEAIGQLAGGIAHDFNNILGAILGNAELIKLMPPGSPESAECLEAILSASQRATDLVRQILAFSRQQEAKRQPLQLHLVVKEALKLLRASVPTTIEFRANIGLTPTVLADPSEIHQVTMNLCTNAWHAMKDRPGVITVELAETEVDAALARLHPDLRPGRYVRLTVTDNGCGMDSATMEHIFEPFFTTKPVGLGTGLGLAVVHGIVKNHDGGIVVRSEPGVGTAFQIYFPVFEAEVVAAPAAARPVPRGTGEHVLFVDDEEALARMGRAVLERLGYRVTRHTNSTEALAAFRAQPGAFDLVVTDYNMPGLNGVELGKQLLAVRPDMRLILSTGFSATVTEEVARELGFCELMHKPYDMRCLGETVHRVLHATRPAS